MSLVGLGRVKTKSDLIGSMARITAPQHCCPLHPNQQTLFRRAGRGR
jgi:hypothetical protein